MAEFGYDLGIDGLGFGTRIGEGGSAVVYRARQEDLDREVAVKLLAFSADDDTRRRFDRERRLMGRLSQHEGIVTVHETGFNSRGEPYIIMPLLGGSLADEIRVGPLPWERAAAIVADVCRTVGFAHDHDIVHRDLKPGNIMMSSGGRPLVADFGIARIVDSNANLEATTLALTPAYSPPEALDTTIAHPTGDVYSLGATLYALIVGHPPYWEGERAPTLMTLMHSIVNDPVPSLGTNAPPQIQAILERAMAKLPQDRYLTVNELGDALDATTESVLAAREAATVRVSPPIPVVGRSSSRRLIPAVMASGTVAVAAIGGWLLLRDDPPTPETATSAATTTLDDPGGASSASQAGSDATTVAASAAPTGAGVGPDTAAPSTTSGESSETVGDEIAFKAVSDDVTGFDAPSDWTVERAFTTSSFYSSYPDLIEHTVIAVTDPRTDDGFFDEEGFVASASFDLVDELGLRVESPDDFAEAAEPFLRSEFDFAPNCNPNQIDTPYSGPGYHGILRTWESCGDNATIFVDGLLVDTSETHAVVVQLRPGTTDTGLLIERVIDTLNIDADALARELAFNSATSGESSETVGDEIAFKAVSDDVTGFDAPSDWTVERAFTTSSFYSSYPDLIEHTVIAVTDPRTDDGFFDEEGFVASASFDLVDELGLRVESPDDFAEAAEPFLRSEFDWAPNCNPNQIDTPYSGPGYHGILRTWESCGDNATIFVDGLLVDTSETHAVVVQLRPGTTDTGLLIERVIDTLNVDADALAEELAVNADDAVVAVDRAKP